MIIISFETGKQDPSKIGFELVCYFLALLKSMFSSGATGLEMMVEEINVFIFF